VTNLYYGMLFTTHDSPLISTEKTKCTHNYIYTTKTEHVYTQSLWHNVSIVLHSQDQKATYANQQH